MKVIDLLVKIANSEEVPKKFRLQGFNRIFTYNKEHQWFDDIYIDDYCKSEIDLSELNDEVEIIEDTPKENKKIEHLKLHAPYPECTDDRFDDVEDKINEIIDYINGE